MKIDRLLSIITILLQKEKVTAPELAEKLEVSRRTISRDIDDICKAGIPIVTRQGGDGGISIAEGFRLDKSVLTEDELQTIITGLKSLGTVSNTANIERLLLKLSPQKNSMMSLKDHIIIDLGSYHKASLSEKIGVIKDAINEGKEVAFRYYSDKGDSQRTIEPYFIIFKWLDWYVYGYCKEKEDFRLFKLNRLWHIFQTDNSFTPREIPAEQADLDLHFTDHNNIKILFDQSIRYVLIEEYGLNCFTETEDGRLFFEGNYTNWDYIVKWVLGFGDKAEIVFPDELKKEIKKQAKKMFEKYEIEI